MVASESPSPEEEVAYWRQLERDYYALLGVPRDASSTEIRNRFLSLSREFHPDRRRQDNSAIVAAANAQYAVLDRAYKVLFDPVKRNIYDQYGEKGVQALEQNGLPPRHTVGTHLKSADEVQRYVQKILYCMNQQALEAQFSSDSRMSMNLDASAFVQAPMQGFQSLFQRGARCIKRTEMSILQRVELPLTPSTSLTLGGYMYDKNATGASGSFTAALSYRSIHPSTPSFTLTSQLGDAPKLHCQISQPVSPYTVFLLVPEIDEHGLNLAVGLNRMLSVHMHGAMMWSLRNGLFGSMNQSSGPTTTMATIGVNTGGPTVTLQCRRLLHVAMTIKVAIQASLQTGVSVVASASREISNRTRIAFSLALARAGVTLRVGFTRGSVRFVMPVFLSPFSAQSASYTFCAATSPFVITALIAQVLKPAHERRKRQQAQYRHDQRVQYLTAARQGAFEQQQLMRRCAEDKRRLEAERTDHKGLVILRGQYGVHPTNGDVVNAQEKDQDALQEVESDYRTNEAIQCVDVTIPLQFLVKNGELALNSSSKASLLGFYNPCVAESDTIADTRASVSAPKPLLYAFNGLIVIGLVWKSHFWYGGCCSYVRYAYDTQVFEATFEDDQAVLLPSKYAQIIGPLGRVY